MRTPIGIIKSFISLTDYYMFLLPNRSYKILREVQKKHNVWKNADIKSDTYQDLEIKQQLQQSTPSLPSSLTIHRTDVACIYSFVLDEKVAGAMVDLINANISKIVPNQKFKVIELNPGLGLLTEKLLQITPKLIVYNGYEFPAFRGICDNFANHIDVRKVNIFYLHKKWSMPYYHEVYDELFECEDDEKKIVIGINPTRLFFRRLTHLILERDITFFRNTELYFGLSEDVYYCLTSYESKFSRPIDYAIANELLDLQVLKSFPWVEFFPKRSSDKKLFFTKIVRKEVDLEADKLISYLNFVKLVVRCKQDPVISTLERWFPGAGPYFIAKGLSMTNRISELSSRELVTLYKDVLNLKGYEEAKRMLHTQNILNRIPE